MRVWISLCLFVFLASFTISQTLAFDLQKDWDTEKGMTHHEYSQDFLNFMKDRHILFVAGFLNEGIPGYFKSNMHVVDAEMGTTSSRFYPSSKESIETNATLIRNEVIRLHNKTGKKIVIFGHSKGGAESLFMILDWYSKKYPKEETVDNIILVQAALGGSPLAFSLDRIFSHHHKLHNRFNGLHSMVPEVTQQTLELAFENFKKNTDPETHKRLHSKIFFVPAYQHFHKISLELMASHIDLSYHGEKMHGDHRNDGVLLLKDQVFGSIGRSLGEVHSDHAGTTLDNLLSRSTRHNVHSFTRALFKRVFAIQQSDQEAL